jgi:quercetin dioxygenase-like cupin family protein
MATATATQTPLWFLANLATIKIDGAETGGAWSMVELAGPEGDMPPLHLHSREDEGFYVLEGSLTVFVGGEEIALAPGDCAVAPRGEPHAYRVDSDQARWLAITSPSGFERFVAAVAQPAAAATLPPAPPSIDPAQVAEIAATYGIEILGPPGALPTGA